MALAIIFFSRALSPRIKTVASLGATRRTIERTLGGVASIGLGPPPPRGRWVGSGGAEREGGIKGRGIRGEKGGNGGGEVEGEECKRTREKPKGKMKKNVRGKRGR